MPYIQIFDTRASGISGVYQSHDFVCKMIIHVSYRIVGRYGFALYSTRSEADFAAIVEDGDGLLGCDEPAPTFRGSTTAFWIFEPSEQSRSTCQNVQMEMVNRGKGRDMEACFSLVGD